MAELGTWTQHEMGLPAPDLPWALADSWVSTSRGQQGPGRGAFPQPGEAGRLAGQAGRPGDRSAPSHLHVLDHFQRHIIPTSCYPLNDAHPKVVLRKKPASEWPSDLIIPAILGTPSRLFWL